MLGKKRAKNGKKRLKIPVFLSLRSSFLKPRDEGSFDCKPLTLFPSFLYIYGDVPTRASSTTASWGLGLGLGFYRGLKGCAFSGFRPPS